MRDAISIPRVKLLHPAVRDEVARIIGAIEATWPLAMAVRVVQGLRTIKEQDALYAQGRTKPGNKVTNAKGGSSYHNYGLAVDFALLYDKDGNGSYETLSWDIKKDANNNKKADWMEVVNFFKSAGWKWGGEWHSLKDYPHLEKSFGHSVRELKRRYDAHEVINDYIKLD
jgi:peptidoglycan LD-endopeptidase CwlK